MYSERLMTNPVINMPPKVPLFRFSGWLHRKTRGIMARKEAGKQDRNGRFPRWIAVPAMK